MMGDMTSPGCQHSRPMTPGLPRLLVTAAVGVGLLAVVPAVLVVETTLQWAARRILELGR